MKWAIRQRLQYIETMAYYAGVITRTALARQFELSDAAATKDLKVYSDMAPRNLQYKQQVYGFVPTRDFSMVFSDLAVEQALAILAGVEYLPVPNAVKIDTLHSFIGNMHLPRRIPEKETVSAITRAIFNQKQLQIHYLSLSERSSDGIRIIEPHCLMNTAGQWYVRAYNKDTFDFRDFMLSRFTSAETLDTAAESNVDYDDDWTQIVHLKFAPHPKLGDKQRKGVLLDYFMQDDILTIPLRRAQIGYLLNMLPVDTSIDQSGDAKRTQLILVNRDEVEIFAAWFFD